MFQISCPMSNKNLFPIVPQRSNSTLLVQVSIHLATFALCLSQFQMSSGTSVKIQIWWGGRWEAGSGWGTHVNPWLIHVNVWQKPLQYCKVISLQLIKIIGRKRNDTIWFFLKNPMNTEAGEPPEPHTFPTFKMNVSTKNTQKPSQKYPQSNSTQQSQKHINLKKPVQ